MPTPKLVNGTRWALYYATRWPEAICWCFRPVVRFFDGQIKWERAKGTETMSKPKAHAYRCVHCDGTIMRVSTKAWIKSYCCKAQRTVRLQRVK